MSTWRNRDASGGLAGASGKFESRPQKQKPPPHRHLRTVIDRRSQYVRSWCRFRSSIRRNPVVRASAGSETDARPEACGHRQGEGRAEVRKSDRQPARVLRDVAFAVANQALKEPEAIPGGVSPRCGARAAPRTRPLRRLDWQRPFRDGRAMPFTRAVPPRRVAAVHG